MAQFEGFVRIPHGSYDEFRNATLGNGYDADFAYQNQCWDFVAELYYQYGLTLYTGPNISAYECWTYSKDKNAKSPFIAVEGISNIKRGDVVVLNKGGWSSNGHIALADQDYNGTNYLNLLGQNQGQGSSAPSNIANVNISNFLGIFRNTDWQSSPPVPTKKSKKRDFPWSVAWRNWSGFKR